MNCFDSRSVRRGDTFFALQGERVSGESFLEEVAQRGASSAVVSKAYNGPSYGMELTYVDDVLAELQRRARARLEAWDVPVIGITGSVGKTTMKDFTAKILSEQFVVGSPIGSYNSQVSLPITILNFSGSEEVLVLELGMNQPGEMARLVSIARPTGAILTHVSGSHLGFFDDLSGIAREKVEIFNSDRLKWGLVSEQASKWCSAEVYGYERKGDCVRIGDSPWFDFHMLEAHFLANLSGACMCARKLDMDWQTIIAGATKLKPSRHRFERIEKEGVTIIDDSYNASEVSTINALKHLPEGKKRLLVFGEIGELGRFSKGAHEAVAQVALECVDVALCLGEGSKPIVEAFAKMGKYSLLAKDKGELKREMERIGADVVLVKGSKYHALWEVIE
ncbi:MAG: UDP-N-acetylmuramoyl-tripeptide--D-alanyl-D-alanine ligase [Simkaniaceae bacterium]|nr:UDP-N-acetylmuramoyl-tripeptide--D-alanyl-D-alanine ligase [Simkaniaceae bacterium]